MASTLDPWAHAPTLPAEHLAHGSTELLGALDRVFAQLDLVWNEGAAELVLAGVVEVDEHDAKVLAGYFSRLATARAGER